MNGRSYYQWLLNLIDRLDAQVEYIQGHLTEATLKAGPNNKADFYATTSQNFLQDLPQMLIPTFFMNSFTFHSVSDGWIESNILSYVDALLAQYCADELGTRSTFRMST